MDLFKPPASKIVLKKDKVVGKLKKVSFDLFAYAKHHGLARTAEISKLNVDSKITLLSTDYISG